MCLEQIITSKPGIKDILAYKDFRLRFVGNKYKLGSLYYGKQLYDKVNYVYTIPKGLPHINTLTFKYRPGYHAYADMSAPNIRCVVRLYDVVAVGLQIGCISGWQTI